MHCTNRTQVRFIHHLKEPRKVEGGCVGDHKHVLWAIHALGLVEKVGEVPPPALRSGLSRLIEAEILYERGRPPDASYTFKHVLLRDTAYHSQLRSDRRQTHARVARILEREFAPRMSAEPALVAHHCAEVAYDKTIGIVAHGCPVTGLPLFISSNQILKL